MKLKNKKTGEIVDTLCRDDITKGLAFGVDHHDGNPTMAYYNSLAELNAEWEDYEEPKEYWAIDCFSPDGELVSQFGKCSERIIENRKQIGNYFETREEAEKAVEKLKAWQRLKDKGFRFIDWELDMKTVADGKIWFDVGLNTQWDAEHLLECEPDVKKDLDLLFGGGE